MVEIIIVMENINLNEILDRQEQEKKLINYLNYFQENKHDLLTKRSI